MLENNKLNSPLGFQRLFYVNDGIKTIEKTRDFTLKI